MAQAKIKVGDIVKVDISADKTWKSHFETGHRGLVVAETRGGFFVTHSPKSKNYSGHYDADDLTVVVPRSADSELRARRLWDKDGNR